MSRGWTLLELVATLVLLAIVGTLASRLVGQALGTWSDLRGHAERRAQMSAALEQMGRDVRSSTLRECDSTVLEVERSNSKVVRFEVEGKELKMTIDGTPGEVIAPVALQGDSLCHEDPDFDLVGLRLAAEVESYVHPQ